MRRVQQEAKSEWAIFVFTRITPNAIAAAPVRRRLAHDEAP